MYSAVIEVTQRISATNAENTTLTLAVPEDGNVHIKFKLQDQVGMLFIRVSILIYSTWNVGPRGEAVFDSFVVCNMSSFSTEGLHTLLLRK